jgi:hypothetical protein
MRSSRRDSIGDEAMAAAVKLKHSYPFIQVAIYDAAAGDYRLVELPEPPA